MDSRYPITVQRAMLMLPLYVVMSARVRGEISPDVLSAGLEQARQRHFLLGSRVEFENDGTAYLTRKGAPGFELEVIEAADDRHWERIVRHHLATPFDLEEGPLVRFSLVQADSVSHLVICAHHVICDGISLGFLIRDILTYCGNPSAELPTLAIPPRVTQETASTPLKVPALRRWIISKIKGAWDAKGIRFDRARRQSMLRRYFEENNAIQVDNVELSPHETSCLVSRCRKERVTVNSAIWAAFLTAQHLTLPKERIHATAGLARNLRPLMRPDLTDFFGFFAASMTLQLPFKPNLAFWKMARNIHERIRRRLDAENPFQMLILEHVHPTLVDSMYFQKLGFIDEKLSRKMLKLAHWHRLYYGCAITNVGRLNIPEEYGHLNLEAVQGPAVYSDVNEKTVGITTAAGRLSISMTTNGLQVTQQDASQLLYLARSTLLKNSITDSEHQG